MTTSVLVVDDEALLRTAFSSLINAEEDLDVVGEAADGRQAVQLATNLSPNVVVMDVRMPVMDGIEATRRITSAGGSRVLILTTFDLDEYVFEALRAGASGFALKSRPPEELLSAIRTVAAGEAPVARRRHRHGPTPARQAWPGAGAGSRPGPLRRRRGAADTADAHLGDDRRHSRMDRRLGDRH